MSNGEIDTQTETHFFLIGTLVVVLLVSLGFNIFVYKAYNMASEQSKNIAQQSQQAEQMINNVGAMVNDLKAYAADKPELQKVLQGAGVR